MAIKTRTAEVSLTAERLNRPLKETFRTSLRTTGELNSLLVTATDGSGLFGQGEAAPIYEISGETLENCIALVRQGEYHKSHAAMSAVTTALLALEAKQKNITLARLLGVEKTNIYTDITISIDTPEGMAKQAENAISLGFRSIKLKLGQGSLDEDFERLSMIFRTVNGKATIYADANQHYSPEEAVQLITKCEQAGLTLAFLEQPVAAKDLAGLKYVRGNTKTPVCADESVFTYDDAVKILQLDCADIINIKLTKCGGIAEAARIIELCSSFGKTCMIGCMLESEIAVNAAAIVAAKYPEVVRYVDLDGHMLCGAEKSPLIVVE